VSCHSPLHISKTTNRGNVNWYGSIGDHSNCCLSFNCMLWRLPLIGPESEINNYRQLTCPKSARQKPLKHRNWCELWKRTLCCRSQTVASATSRHLEMYRLMATYHHQVGLNIASDLYTRALSLIIWFSRSKMMDRKKCPNRASKIASKHPVI
jgi:hypothetical protein